MRPDKIWGGHAMFSSFLMNDMTDYEIKSSKLLAKPGSRVELEENEQTWV